MNPTQQTNQRRPPQGGQHSTPDRNNKPRRETDAQQFERLRGAYAELGQPFPAAKIRKCQTVPDQQSLVQRFNELVDRTATSTNTSS